MFRKMLLVFAGTSFWSASAIAQNAELPDPFKYLSAEQVLALTNKPGPGPNTAFLNRHDNFYVEYAFRTDTNNIPEVHTHWTHYINILEGDGTLIYGGKLSGAKETAPGEMRGGVIQDGTSLALHQGDYLQIPAGMPHQIAASNGKRIRYVLFNIRL